MTDHPGKAAIAAIIVRLYDIPDEGAYGVNIGKLRSIATYVSELEAFKARAQDEAFLLSIIADIREKSGVGDGPMLTELADAIKAKVDGKP